MFSSHDYLTDAIMARLTETRVTDPECAWRAAQARHRRRCLVPSGKLNILAADHPARRVTKVGDNPIAMADRQDYLGRIVRVLSSDGIDGLMATMDLLEDLFILDACIRDAGGTSLLDGKVLIGSLNRGGLAGTSWELDDPITGPTPATCSAWRLDGAKLLLRIADEEPGSLKTMLASAQAINECNALRLPMFLEPLPVTRKDSGWSVVKERAALARIAGVASALGDSSRYLWLKLPYCEGYETVARSTSLPILLLGGESAGNPAPFLGELASAMQAGPNVRGALVGRNVLYPGDEDPLAMACAVGGIIHQSWTVDQALESLPANRGRGLDLLSRYF
ncbi:deoxyribose-phosphate aldolase [uncultured Paludibaculum sp.]|uniref:class I fructose-bisphosphate aldolase n=1 Tax=uncultured Paludibaculum sp. TaxID=1765020 RepID=UPI002AABC08C|nr:deoxyribose-phosphate aldolase [uncultured Paludibaculum sp.]